MISSISYRIVLRLLNLGTITKSEQVLYEYGLFLLISQLLYFVFTLISGFLIGLIWESILFFVAFQSIRQVAGGYHATTETRCEILSSLSILSSLMLIKIMYMYNEQEVILLISCICALIILIFAPLDTDEKPLSNQEFLVFKRKTYLILSILAIIIVISYSIKSKMIFLPCCISLVLEAILLIAGKIKSYKRKIDIE